MELPMEKWFSVEASKKSSLGREKLSKAMTSRVKKRPNRGNRNKD
jgi:hypothetical protein